MGRGETQVLNKNVWFKYNKTGLSIKGICTTKFHGWKWFRDCWKSVIKLCCWSEHFKGEVRAENRFLVILINSDVLGQKSVTHSRCWRCTAFRAVLWYCIWEKHTNREDDRQIIEVWTLASVGMGEYGKFWIICFRRFCTFKVSTAASVLPYQLQRCGDVTVFMKYVIQWCIMNQWQSWVCTLEFCNLFWIACRRFEDSDLSLFPCVQTVILRLSTETVGIGRCLRSCLCTGISHTCRCSIHHWVLCPLVGKGLEYLVFKTEELI